MKFYDGVSDEEIDIKLPEHHYFSFTKAEVMMPIHDLILAEEKVARENRDHYEEVFENAVDSFFRRYKGKPDIYGVAKFYFYMGKFMANMEMEERVKDIFNDGAEYINWAIEE